MQATRANFFGFEKPSTGTLPVFLPLNKNEAKKTGKIPVFPSEKRDEKKTRIYSSIWDQVYTERNYWSYSGFLNGIYPVFFTGIMHVDYTSYFPVIYDAISREENPKLPNTQYRYFSGYFGGISSVFYTGKLRELYQLYSSFLLGYFAENKSRIVQYQIPVFFWLFWRYLFSILHQKNCVDYTSYFPVFY